MKQEKDKEPKSDTKREERFKRKECPVYHHLHSDRRLHVSSPPLVMEAVNLLGVKDSGQALMVEHQQKANT